MSVTDSAVFSLLPLSLNLLSHPSTKSISLAFSITSSHMSALYFNSLYILCRWLSPPHMKLDYNSPIQPDTVPVPRSVDAMDPTIYPILFLVIDTDNQTQFCSYVFDPCYQTFLFPYGFDSYNKTRFCFLCLWPAWPDTVVFLCVWPMLPLFSPLGKITGDFDSYNQKQFCFLCLWVWSSQPDTVLTSNSLPLLHQAGHNSVYCLWPIQTDTVHFPAPVQKTTLITILFSIIYIWACDKRSWSKVGHTASKSNSQ